MALYVSVDLETTGVNPHRHKILSIGACAVTVGQADLAHQEGEFYINCKEPKELNAWDPDTKNWWSQQDDVARRAYKVEPTHSEASAMAMFTSWLMNLERKKIDRGVLGERLEPVNLVFYPTHYDYRWLISKAGELLLVQSEIPLYDFWFDFNNTTCVDLHTMSATLLQVEQYQGRKSHWPEEWTEDVEQGLAHHALDDARMQMGYFLAMRRWAREHNKSAYTPKPTTTAEEGK